jgi:hypothetical protein
MSTLLQWAQVAAGVGFPVLAEPWRELPHGVGQWFSSIRDFLVDSECTIQIANTYTVTTRRVHDNILMEDAMTRDFIDGKMRWINPCRLFLQVECHSDVCTADGLRRDPGLEAQPPKVTSQSTIKWPAKGSQDGARGQYGEKALSDGYPTGNRAALYHCHLLAVPSSTKDRVFTTTSNRID